MNLEPRPPWVNIVVLLSAAAVVWFAGVQVTRCAKLIAERTKMGQAFIGAVLLGGLVSLPEMATAMTASAIGNAPLAMNTLLGGIAASMAMIAVTDAAVGGEPLDIDVIRPIVLFQGTLLILFLAVAAAGIIVGDVAFLGVRLWAYALLALYVLFVMLLKRYRMATPGCRKRERDKASAMQNEGENTGVRPKPSQMEKLRRGVGKARPVQLARSYAMPDLPVSGF